MLSFLAFAGYFLYYWKFTFFSKKISICFRVAFREPCAKNGFPPPRPFSSLFTCFTSSRTSPFLCPMAYLYPSLSFPAKKLQHRCMYLKSHRYIFLLLLVPYLLQSTAHFLFPHRKLLSVQNVFAFLLQVHLLSYKLHQEVSVLHLLSLFFYRKPDCNLAVLLRTF